MKTLQLSVRCLIILFLVPPLLMFSSGLNEPNLQKEFSSLVHSGTESRLTGEFDRAIEHFENALILAEKMGDVPGQSQALCELGLLFWNIGRIDLSTEYYQKALSLSENRNTELREDLLSRLDVVALYKDGKKFRSQSQYRNSADSFLQADAIAQKINSREHQVKCLRQLGVTYLQMNNLDEFYVSTKKALDLAAAIPHRIEEARCSYNLGIYFNDIYDYSRALKYYEDALSIFRNIESVPDESNTMVNISDIYIQLGNYEKALLYLQDVLALDRQAEDDLYVAMDLNNIGVIHRKKGLQSDNSEDLFKALEVFEECLLISRRIEDEKIEVQCLNNLGTVYTDLKNYPEALQNMFLGLDIAKKLQDEEEVSTILLNTGLVYSKQKQFDKAVEAFDLAIAIADKIDEKSILWEAHGQAGLAFKEMKDYGRALDHFNSSIEMIEDIRSKIHLEELKASYFGSDERIDSYYNLVDLFFEMSREYPEKNYLRDAFETMEKAKARAFLDRLELSRIEPGGDIHPDLLKREAELMEAISNINAALIKPGLDRDQQQDQLDKLNELEQELESLNREIRLKSPSYANLKHPQTVSLEEAQAVLPDDSTAYFAYCIGKSCAYGFVITREKISVFPLPNTEVLRSKIKAYLQVITDKDSSDFQLGYELFTQLVQPGLVQGIDRIIFIPDDILHFLPFETLLTQKNNLSWLVQDYRVSYVPSITSFREILLRKRENKKDKDILSFGNPYFGEYEKTDSRSGGISPVDARSDFRINPLVYSQSEVDKIAALFKRKRRSVYTGVEASETSLKQADLSDYKIVHFATHGLIDNRNPARSSIVLAMNDLSSEDGFLQMREVFDLKMDTDLVTLSACQTGLGQFIKGEGIEGINRAFFFAGASSVLMSLWAVNDQASYQIMQRFYTHLRSSDSIVDALRRSKIELIGSEVLSHPFYWAGFILSGSADTVLFSSRRANKFFPSLLMALLFGVAIFVAAKSTASKP